MTRVIGAIALSALGFTAATCGAVLAFFGFATFASALGVNSLASAAAAFVSRGAVVLRSVGAFFTVVFFSAAGVVSLFVDINLTPK
ncbi:MAG TPA: hypothetical protein PLZ79_05910 [Burkholderiales bacterium]|nr:hypothetical protein [Burkholderiales bacterium]